MNRKLNFRTASRSDIAQILLIEEKCFDVYRMNRRQVLYHLERETSHIIVVEDLELNIIIGSAVLMMHWKYPRARIFSLAVLPEMQGQKIGQRIIFYLEDLAIRLNAKK